MELVMYIIYMPKNIYPCYNRQKEYPKTRKLDKKKNLCYQTVFQTKHIKTFMYFHNLKNDKKNCELTFMEILFNCLWPM